MTIESWESHRSQDDSLLFRFEPVASFRRFLADPDLECEGKTRYCVSAHCSKSVLSVLVHVRPLEAWS